MGILNNFMDKFKNAEFTVAPNKKLKTISGDFKKAYFVPFEIFMKDYLFLFIISLASTVSVACGTRRSLS